MRKFVDRLLSTTPSKPDAKDGETSDAVRLGKLERDAAVLAGQLPPGTDELPLLSEYRLATWLSGPGR